MIEGKRINTCDHFFLFQHKFQRFLNHFCNLKQEIWNSSFERGLVVPVSNNCSLTQLMTSRTFFKSRSLERMFLFRWFDVGRTKNCRRNLNSFMRTIVFLGTNRPDFVVFDCKYRSSHKKAVCRHMSIDANRHYCQEPSCEGHHVPWKFSNALETFFTERKLRLATCEVVITEIFRF